MGVSFEVDHIIPKALGGETRLENLCLSCPACNRYKANRIEGVDPESGEIAPLYNPRTQKWEEHFAWSEDGTQIMGLTAIGRATIATLRMNRPSIVQLRRYWVALGMHPEK